MNDRHAQFLIVVVDACLGAELAKLSVELLTRDGVRYCGVPVADEPHSPLPAMAPRCASVEASSF